LFAPRYIQTMHGGHALFWLSSLIPHSSSALFLSEDAPPLNSVMILSLPPFLRRPRRAPCAFPFVPRRPGLSASELKCFCAVRCRRFRSVMTVRSNRSINSISRVSILDCLTRSISASISVGLVLGIFSSLAIAGRSPRPSVITTTSPDEYHNPHFLGIFLGENLEIFPRSPLRAEGTRRSRLGKSGETSKKQRLTSDFPWIAPWNH
jgi:hypothetical protein